MKIPSRFRLATSEQAKHIDANTIESTGISGLMLMEVAGAKAAEYILSKTDVGARVLILCGKGNNAGDALVAARYLSQNELLVSVVFAEGTDNLSPDARTNYNILKKLQDQDDLHFITIHTSLPDLETLPIHNIIVDGLLGIGIKGELRAPYNLMVEFANKANQTVYALDIPTGLNADDGSVLGKCIQADYTFCFGTNKIGCYVGEGPARSGEIVYIDLGFPGYLKSNIKQYVLSNEWVNTLDRRKKKPNHKYEAGNIYVIAGSEGLTGAAIMTAESAWKAGAGSVSVITPRGLLSVFEAHLIHQTKFAVGKKDDTFFKTDHFDVIMEHLSRREGTVAIGPGLGRNEETAKLVSMIIEAHQGNIVIDADAIWALARKDVDLTNSKASIILTPHPGELKNLTGKDVYDSLKRMNIISNYCQEHKLHMVSKGLPAIICTPDGSSFLTQYDTRAFSRTGFGDILTGKIASYWEITGNPLLGCTKALLDGKHKYDEHCKNNSALPEPLDLL
ncbi:MAG: NAD(P)H-hydrate dehydratase [Balneolales bacterium]